MYLFAHIPRLDRACTARQRSLEKQVRLSIRKRRDGESGNLDCPPDALLARVWFRVSNTTVRLSADIFDFFIQARPNLLDERNLPHVMATITPRVKTNPCANLDPCISNTGTIPVRVSSSKLLDNIHSTAHLLLYSSRRNSGLHQQCMKALPPPDSHIAQ